MALVVEQSRIIPVNVEAAFTGTLPLPLPTLFRHWYGPIPPIKAVRDQDGEWTAVGQTRTVLLKGGGSMDEQLTQVNLPHSFDYTLTGITGAMAPLASRVDGQWRFVPSGTGTEVSWQWTIHPRSALSAPALPVLGWLWRGYARGALKELSTLLPAGA